MKTPLFKLILYLSKESLVKKNTIILVILNAQHMAHLRFKQAQTNMRHSPKLEDGVENQFLTLGPIFLGIFTNFELSYLLNGLSFWPNFKTES